MLTLAGIARDALRLYRGHPWRVAGTALLLFTPLGVLTDLLSDAIHPLSGTSPAASLSAVAVSLGAALLALLAEIFYAGLLDYTVGRPDPPSVTETLMRLPWGRLLVVQLVGAVLIVAGLLIFVLPGLAVLTLLSIAGPIVVLEDRDPLSALARSIRLVLPHWRLAAMVVLVPVVVGAAADSAVEAWLPESLPASVAIGAVLAVTVDAAYGLLIAVLGHALVASDPVPRSPAG
jgi:hypothetical protein